MADRDDRRWRVFLLLFNLAGLVVLGAWFGVHRRGGLLPILALVVLGVSLMLGPYLAGRAADRYAARRRTE